MEKEMIDNEDEIIDPTDNGDEWREPRTDPWGRTWYLDVIDNGNSWLIIDGNGCCHSEPKRKVKVNTST